MRKRRQKHAKRRSAQTPRFQVGQLSAAADQGQTWPEGYFELFGSIQDPTFQEVANLDTQSDSPRESL